MQIKQTKICKTELLINVSESLPIIGTFLKHDSDIDSKLSNIFNQDIAENILLTSDFIYIKSKNEDQLEDLELITLAEIDDYLKNDNYKIDIVASSQNLEEKIKLILALIVAPFLKKDNGNIEYCSINNGIVKVKFLGKCNGCPYAEKTLKERVEKNLIHYLPSIKGAIIA